MCVVFHAPARTLAYAQRPSATGAPALSPKPAAPKTPAENSSVPSRNDAAEASSNDDDDDDDDDDDSEEEEEEGCARDSASSRVKSQ